MINVLKRRSCFCFLWWWRSSRFSPWRWEGACAFGSAASWLSAAAIPKVSSRWSSGALLTCCSIWIHTEAVRCRTFFLARSFVSWMRFSLAILGVRAKWWILASLPSMTVECWWCSSFRWSWTVGFSGFCLICSLFASRSHRSRCWTSVSSLPERTHCIYLGIIWWIGHWRNFLIASPWPSWSIWSWWTRRSLLLCRRDWLSSRFAWCRHLKDFRPLFRVISKRATWDVMAF